MEGVALPFYQRNCIAALAQIQGRTQASQSASDNDNVQLILTPKRVSKKRKGVLLSKFCYILVVKPKAIVFLQT
jgi:hypothetical protein